MNRPPVGELLDTVTALRKRITVLESDLQAATDGAKLLHEQDALRIKELEAGLRDALSCWCVAEEITTEYGNPPEKTTTDRIVELRALLGDQ